MTAGEILVAAAILLVGYGLCIIVMGGLIPWCRKNVTLYWIMPYKLTLWASWNWKPLVQKVNYSYWGLGWEEARVHFASAWTGRDWEVCGWSWPFCWGGNLGLPGN